MKKIMFNDRYGLTEAVLAGRKTMTRRIIPELKGRCDCNLTEWGIDKKGRAVISLVLELPFSKEYLDIYPHYQPGEVVAVAQKYKDIPNPFYGRATDWADAAGWENKMFVKADLMPHQIRITNIRVERLQDISEEDCFKEGICRKIDAHKKPTQFCGFKGTQKLWFSPHDAFAALIDKVSGKGTWASNPWVFVYVFELVEDEK